MDWIHLTEDRDQRRAFVSTVINTRNYRVLGLCPLSSILKSYRTQPFGNWGCYPPQMRGETPTLLDLLERANLNHWATYGNITRAIQISETRLYQWEVGGKTHTLLHPCGGGVEYLHRDPASRRRRRKGTSQI
jgi:hypothetical protein